MYISRFQVSSYKSFRETELLSLSPSGVNIVTGQNNVGKTALLEALALDLDGTAHRSRNVAPEIDFRPLPPSKINLQVALSNGELFRIIRGQNVRIPLPELGFKFASFPAMTDRSEPALQKFKDWFFSLDSYTFTLWLLAGEGNKGVWETSFPSFGLFTADGGPHADFIDCLVEHDCTIKLLRSEPIRTGRADDLGYRVTPHLQEYVYRFAAERFSKGVSRFGSNSTLGHQAENLPEVLGVLQGTQRDFQTFNDTVAKILPQIAYVNVVPHGSDEQKILVWTTEAQQAGRKDLAFGLDASGTGIGQVLAIVYVVLTSKTPKVILIDEPQSFLHPGAARKLIEVLKQHPMHQYIIATHSPTIITAASPETIILVTHNGTESRLERLDHSDASHLRRYFNEIGASFADVYGADSILWVEGITEEKCFPMIVERILGTSLMGTVIKAVVATGDFDGKHAEQYFRIYERLSKAQSAIPPAIGFIFDDEERSDSEKRDLSKLGKGLVYFTKRLMYENYLLDVPAITAVLNETDGHTKILNEADVQGWIDDRLADSKFYNQSTSQRSLNWIRADRFLKELFRDLAGLDFRKPQHSIELTEWLLKNDPTKLGEVVDLIRLALKW